MDILPSGNIFRELQDIYDTGYFSSQSSIEAQWNQVNWTLCRSPFIFSIWSARIVYYNYGNLLGHAQNV